MFNERDISHIPYSGRKRLCLIFCVTYTLTCVCIQFSFLPILLLGRVLGGISTSILYSAFESWLISSSTSLALAPSDLSTIMGRATLLNGFVATGAGVVSNQLVSTTTSFASPFVASAALLVLAYVVIRGTWMENYGGGGGGIGPNTDPLQLRRLNQAWRIVREGA
jgi:MFS family permease